MAVYKIFPESDTFIFTEEILGNAGLDEILELGGYPVAGIGQTSRIITKFDTAKIQDTINNKVSGTGFQAKLHLSLASAYELPTSYSVNTYPLYDQYTTGVGKFQDLPVDKSGASWLYRSPAALASRWTVPSVVVNMPTGVTGSYNSTYQGGGGSWYTGSNGVNLEAVETYNLNSTHDLDIDITNAVTLHYSGSIVNNGYITKLSNDLEFNTASSIRLKYYGKDTNTIYPPSLDIKWDDSVYATGSLSLLTSDNSVISITNNKGKYINSGKQRFRISAKPKYPVRSFSTGSIYLTNYALPQSSTWAIRDEFTDEMIIDFDSTYTKISCDSQGSYFDMYLDGVQPERYYRVLIKAELGSTNTVVDADSVFKVVRNG